ncbi:hypothetical protein E1A91_D07G139900v1 [Gossypium mustelinum]|uniref:Uncharacterized protein n=1 Tax=Gossypium mustelinum TaxID=34275 RepID=A0A5D2UA08_GOSMU|nr:hypothetical protein E1A91_D07G139900v1 [Gossypium mustelinum]TYI73601.1 hypothetical protein E1A91_D07G139900v1 [Gossypium mustelinum]
MVISGDGSSRSKSTMWGWLLVGIGSLVLLGFLFTAFISHLLPPSNYTLIAATKMTDCKEPGFCLDYRK